MLDGRMGSCSIIRAGNEPDWAFMELVISPANLIEGLIDKAQSPVHRSKRWAQAQA